MAKPTGMTKPILWRQLQELEEIRHRGLKEWQQELEARPPSCEDLRLEEHRRQQEMIRRLVERRREKKQAGRSGLITITPVAEQGEEKLETQSNLPPEPPKPWTLVLQTSSGLWYYYNPETGITSWDPPLYMAERPTEPHHPWELVLHSESGIWYYHQTETGETSWTAPSTELATQVLEHGTPPSDAPEVRPSAAPLWTRGALRRMSKRELLELCVQEGLEVGTCKKVQIAERLLELQSERSVLGSDC